jgi:hypothetical protein
MFRPGNSPHSARRIHHPATTSEGFAPLHFLIQPDADSRTDGGKDGISRPEQHGRIMRRYG